MKITSIVAFEDSVLFNVDATVPAYKADENGEMVQTEDTQFSMSYADLARQTYPLNADIAELRSLRGQHLSGEDWIKLLTGAKIAVDFTFVKAGDTVGEHTYENTGYIKTLKKLELDERVASRLDRALSFWFSIAGSAIRGATCTFTCCGNYKLLDADYGQNYKLLDAGCRPPNEIKEPSSSEIKEPSSEVQKGLLISVHKSYKHSFIL